MDEKINTKFPSPSPEVLPSNSPLLSPSPPNYQNLAQDVISPQDVITSDINSLYRATRSKGIDYYLLYLLDLAHTVQYSVRGGGTATLASQLSAPLEWLRTLRDTYPSERLDTHLRRSAAWTHERARNRRTKLAQYVRNWIANSRRWAQDKHNNPENKPRYLSDKL
jgi:hypothetical protein